MLQLESCELNPRHPSAASGIIPRIVAQNPKLCTVIGMTQAFGAFFECLCLSIELCTLAKLNGRGFGSAGAAVKVSFCPVSGVEAA